MPAEDFTDASGPRPIAWWNFNNDLTDGSGNGNTLTNNNSATFSTDSQEGGYSAATDGVSQYLSRAQASITTGYPHKAGETTVDFTVGGWVKYTSTPNDFSRFYGMGSTADDALTFRTVSGSFEAKINDGVTGVPVAANASWVVGVWYHVVARWRGTTDDEFVMFVNGVKQSSSAAMTSSASAGATCPFTFGCLADPTPGAFAPVRLDEWFGFNVAITDAQIAAIFATGLTGMVRVVQPTRNVSTKRRKAGYSVSSPGGFF